MTKTCHLLMNVFLERAPKLWLHPIKSLSPFLPWDISRVKRRYVFWIVTLG